MAILFVPLFQTPAGPAISPPAFSFIDREVEQIENSKGAMVNLIKEKPSFQEAYEARHLNLSVKIIDGKIKKLYYQAFSGQGDSHAEVTDYYDTNGRLLMRKYFLGETIDSSGSTEMTAPGGLSFS